jgi:hypothetical protein
MLTDRSVDIGRVRRLRDKLDSAVSKLEVLHNPDCTEEQANKAWHWVFQHMFWSTDDAAAKSMDEYGKRLGEAARQGTIFVTSTGRISTEAPEERHIRAPSQRFYSSS